MGRRPKRSGRDIHGILLLDKPLGMSSNHALQQVKSLFNANKVGHTGALDPLATGMLPICFGEATKFARYLLDADKRYHVVARLGERTDTADTEGKIIQTRAVNVNMSEIEHALALFRGKIKQIPSMYSALKFQGKPLYEYARCGIAIARESRAIEVYQLELINLVHNQLELNIHCSKGTYIRTIIDDLGEQLGCGAHVVKLHRLQVADYPVDYVATLNYLHSLSQETTTTSLSTENRLDSLLLPFDSAVSHYAEINLPMSLALKFKQGATVQCESAYCEQLVRVTQGDDHRFIGMAQVDATGNIIPKRLVADTFMSS